MIKTHLERLVDNENTIDGLLTSLRGLSACKHEA